MFPEQLKKILDVIKQTGDRVVIFDGSHPDDAFVIMDLASYAKKFGAEERSAATFPETAAVEPAVKNIEAEETKKTDLSPKLPKSAELTEEDLTDKINREISMWKNREVSPFLSEENKHKSGWQIPPTVKKKAQEVE